MRHAIIAIYAITPQPRRYITGIATLIFIRHAAWSYYTVIGVVIFCFATSSFACRHTALGVNFTATYINAMLYGYRRHYHYLISPRHYHYRKVYMSHIAISPATPTTINTPHLIYCHAAGFGVLHYGAIHAGYLQYYACHDIAGYIVITIMPPSLLSLRHYCIAFHFTEGYRAHCFVIHTPTLSTLPIITTPLLLSLRISRLHMLHYVGQLVYGHATRRAPRHIAIGILSFTLRRMPAICCRQPGVLPSTYL